MSWTRRFTLPLSFGLVLIALLQLWPLLVELRASDDGDNVVVSDLVLRGVALASFCAHYSLAVQVRGLLGAQGLHPITQSLRTLQQYLSSSQEESDSDSDSEGHRQSLTLSAIAHALSKLLDSSYMRRQILCLVLAKFTTASPNITNNNNNTNADNTKGNSDNDDADSSNNDTNYNGKSLTNRLQRLVWVDVALSLLAVLFPHPLLFAALYFSYYSYKRVSGPFLNFQWDVLLLEALFLAVPLSLSLACAVQLPPSPSQFDKFKSFLLAYFPRTVSLWLYRVLFFRLLFGSGLVKGYGSDASWHTLCTAMCFHFLTQPLPNALGRWAHLHLPESALKAMTTGTLWAEIPLPLLALLGSKTMNAIVFVGNLGLQLSISTVGSFGFFNYLTIVLSLSLLRDDQLLLSAPTLRTLHSAMCSSHTSLLTSLTQCVTLCVVVTLSVALFVSNTVALTEFLQRTRWVVTHTSSSSLALDNISSVSRTLTQAQREWPTRCERFAQGLYETVFSDTHAYLSSVWYLGAQYALFASMTKFRNELRIEISRSPHNTHTQAADTHTDTHTHIQSDGEWELVSFYFKPDDTRRSPSHVSPFFHLPRLDWMMWFLALRVSPALSPSFTQPQLPAQPTQAHAQTATEKEIPTLSMSEAQVVLPKWFLSLLVSLLERNSDVLSLFPSHTRSLFEKKEGGTGEGENLRVRVRLFRYSFHTDTDAHSKTETEREYWDASLLGEVIAPSSLNGLYALCDSLSADKLMRREREAPSAETAKEIIMRTLFKQAQERRKNAQQQQQQEKQQQKEEEPQERFVEKQHQS